MARRRFSFGRPDSPFLFLSDFPKGHARGAPRRPRCPQADCRAPPAFKLRPGDAFGRVYF